MCRKTEGLPLRVYLAGVMHTNPDNPLPLLYFVMNNIIQICSGITRGREWGALYTGSPEVNSFAFA